MTPCLLLDMARGALDPVPRMSEQMIMTTSMGITPPTTNTGLMVNPLERVTPAHDNAHKSERTGLPTQKNLCSIE